MSYTDTAKVAYGDHEERPTPSLTDEQQAAEAAIEEFLRGEGPLAHKQEFVLTGLAGTGKTTVLGRIARKHPSAILCAYTGKAASVLRNKTGINACTIHSAFYRLVEKTKNAKTGRDDLKFARTVNDGDLRRGKIFVDEASMIDESIASDIKRTGAKIVAVMDPGQLQPVKGKRYFDKSDFTLTQIHRQALDSPIIRQAHNVRNTGFYEEDGPGFRVVSRRACDQDVLDAGVILCWTHVTRQKANNYKRTLMGHLGMSPQPGEFVLCLKNCADYGIFNGAVYELEAPFKEGDTSIHIRVDDDIIRVPRVGFMGVRSAVSFDDDEVNSWFDYGYAMTVWKAQGSEWDKVILRDEYTKMDQRREFVYTGITRAAKEIIVIR